MKKHDKSFYFEKLITSRKKFEELLSQIKPQQEVYPGWTIREILAHITGWDEVVLDAVHSHILSIEISYPYNTDLDAFNAISIKKRETLNLELMTKEWRFTRDVLMKLIEQMADDKYSSNFPVPWNRKTKIENVLLILAEHELDHAEDIFNCVRADTREPLS
jgi:hypothetical protein